MTIMTNNPMNKFAIPAELDFQPVREQRPRVFYQSPSRHKNYPSGTGLPIS